jgi:hypothetical protein
VSTNWKKADRAFKKAISKSVSSSPSKGSFARGHSGPVKQVDMHWGIPFSKRPPQSPIVIRFQSDIVIKNKLFSGGNGRSIILESCNNVTIQDIDFDSAFNGIYMLSCTGNLDIGWLRYKNWAAPSGIVNLVQFDKCTFSGSLHDCKGVGGKTEDIISVYKSGGPSAPKALTIERCHFEGTNWSSGSGSGLMIGDGGGGNIVVQDITLTNPGQVGIGIAGGTNIIAQRCTIFGEQRPLSNIGMYVWDQSGLGSSGISVLNNRVRWKDATGTVNGFWNAGNSGVVTNVGNAFNDPTVTAMPVSL